MSKRIIDLMFYKDFMKEDAFPMSVSTEGLIHRGELALISATAKTGKTWFGLHLAMSVTHGIPFLGKFATTPETVLVVQTEVSASNFQKRILAIEDLYVKDKSNRLEIPLISGERIKLDTSEGIQILRDSVLEISPALVILDSFYTFHSGEESSSSDMAPILSEIRAIAHESNCAILVIHHQGKKNENTQGTQTGHKARI